MVIRKKYRIEMAHVVRNCLTERCSQSIHGHSAIIEVLLESPFLDNGFMVLDFNAFKDIGIKDIIDYFDHSFVMWNREEMAFQKWIRENNKRLITIPFNASAESLTIIIGYLIQRALDNYNYTNKEQGIKIHSIIYHETETGYAQLYNDELQSYIKKYEDELGCISFSKAIKDEEKWKGIDNKTIPKSSYETLNSL